MSRIALACLASLVLLLSGCAGMRTLESEVQTYSSLATLPADTSFRFERLPSQAQEPRQAQAEAMAELALAKVGLRRDDSKPSYSVQLGVRVQREDRLDWPDNWYFGGIGAGWGGSRFARRSPWSAAWPPSSPWFQREVSLVIRDLRTGQVAYETHASQEGVWSETKLILPALFNAALSDFPASSTGVRKINVQVPSP